jgi:hypothetical protein
MRLNSHLRQASNEMPCSDGVLHMSGVQFPADNFDDETLSCDRHPIQDAGNADGK